LASGTFLFNVQASGAKFQRHLVIRKMRGTAVAPGAHRFAIDSTHGIVLQEYADAVKPAAPPAFEYFQLPSK